MKQYLVIQLARFGDLIQTKRLLATLCARDEAEVHLCVDNSLASLARIVYPNVIVHQITTHGTGLRGADAKRAILVDNVRAFSELKSINFDAIYNLNFSGLNFRLASLFPPEIVEGYAWNNGQEIIGLWPSMAMRWSNKRRLSINLVDFWAGYCPDMIEPERVNPEAHAKGGGIGVVLAGRESRRSLPVEILSKIVSTMARTAKTEKVFLLGGNSEIGTGQAVMKELPAAIQQITRNFAGKTNWAELVELVGSLDQLLTPDTGTMHLAAHLGTPVSAFFLSSAWYSETGPYGKGHTVFQAFTECLPCLETAPCHNDIKCLGGFADPLFHRFLVTHKQEHIPHNMVVLESSFDALGQVYFPKAGNDPESIQRHKFRQFLWQYLSGKDGVASDLDTMFAQDVFREKDWIAHTKPCSTLGL